MFNYRLERLKKFN